MIVFSSIEKNSLEPMKVIRNMNIPFTREYRYLNDADQEKWYDSYLQQRRTSDWDTEVMIALDDDDLGGVGKANQPLYKILAVGGFVRIEWKNQRAELTCCFAKRDDKVRNKQILLQILKKGFREYNFHKITWPVYEHDTNLELYQQIFTTEAILKEEYFWAGKFQDRHYLSIFRKDFAKM